MSGMSSNRPYLIRALYDWIVDNGLTPHLLVNSEVEHVVVPHQFVQEGRIVLNVAPGAVRHLELSNDWILFEARFGGIPMEVSVPPGAVLGIYAKENGRGMLFPENEPENEKTLEEPQPPTPGGKRPTLTVIK
jgi:stringent starvation protein B